jgi:hypothetical protein
MRKPVVRIVLVLSVLTLAGIVALAAGGHHGIVTSQDGRQSIATHGSSHITPGVREPAGSTLISGNLSKYPNGVYFCCYGDTISGPNSFLGAANWVAVPFTPNANFRVTEVQTSVGWGQNGTNGVTLSINADASGLPGSALASLDVTGLSNFGDCCTLTVGEGPGNSGVPVSKGTQYWLVVSTDTSTETTFDAWAFNSTDMTAHPYAFFNSTNGVWEASDGLLPGYAVWGH